MEINFKYNINKDITNWRNGSSNTTSDYGMDWSKRLPKDFDNSIIGNDTKFKKYINDKFVDNGSVDKYLSYLRQNFNYPYIKDDLGQITGANLNFKEIICYITTFNRCPYNYKEGSFMIYLEREVKDVCKTAYHELMHIIVHNNYWHIFKAKGLSNFHAGQIKEALTVLLNPTLEKRGLPLDKGYPIHQELRKDIVVIAEENKEKSFEELLKLVSDLYIKKYNNIFSK